MAAGIALGLVGLGVRLVERRDRPWPPSSGLVFVLLLAAAAPAGAIVHNVVAPSVFLPRNLISSAPAMALGVGALVTAWRMPLRLAATALVIAGFGIGGVRMLATANQRPEYDAAARFIESAGDPHAPAVEVPEPTPGPQTALEAALAPRGQALPTGRHVYTLDLPDSRARFNVVSHGGVLNPSMPLPAPQKVARQAARDAHGGTIFLVAGDLSLAQFRQLPGAVSEFLAALPAGYHEVESRSFPGASIFPLGVHVLEGKRGSVIAFGCAITDPGIYKRCAQPGIEFVREPDSELIAIASAGLNNPDGTFHDHKLTGSIFRNYNVILDQVAGRDGLEALVLLHQDSEIVDPDFCARLRQSLADPDVAIVGCAGAIGVRSIAWWEGAVTWASFEHRYKEHGGGRIAGPTWDRDDIPAYGHTGEVDTVDGFVIAMSPWAVRELRFVEGLGQFHGYDFDICLQARAAGKKVATQDMKVIHHHSLDLIGDMGGWIEAHVRVAEKWDGRMKGVGEAAGDWKQRARRAEAEADAARMLANATELVRNATADKLNTVTDSISWRLTAPLRWFKRLFSRRG